MAEWQRVRWLGLTPARESTIAAHRFDPEKHEQVDKPAVDGRGNPLPAKYHDTVDAAAARKRPKKATTPSQPPADPAEDPTADHGQASDKEND